MATINILQQFRSLLPKKGKTVVTIIANNGNGTSQAKLRDGTTDVMRGDSVGVGKMAFVEGGEVKGTAPELAQYEAEV